jgi:aromatic-L-amino-acid decarboxylase
VALARDFAAWVEAAPEFELIAPPRLNLVCFARRAGDDFNRRLLETINQSGRMYLTHTVLRGRYVLRFCVGQTHTEPRHVMQGWEFIRSTAGELARTGGNAL